MYQSKLIGILKQMDSKMFKSFKQFVSKQIGQTNKPVELLMKVLIKNYPEFDGKTIDRSQMFKKVYPKEKENPQKLRYVMTDVTKLLEKFLVNEEISNDSYTQSLLLAKAYRRLRLGKHQMSGILDCYKILDESQRRDARHYLNKYLIDVEQFNNSNYLAGFDKNTVLQDILNNLDAFYLTEKLKCICEVINTKNIMQVDYNTQLFEEIIAYLGNRPLDDIPALNIYYCILKTLIDLDNEDYYKKLMDLLAAHNTIFSTYELDDLYSFARNYCIRKINHGQKEFLNELFELYLILLDNELIFQGKYLSQWDYKNLVIIGSRLERFEWVENFMETFKVKLNPEVKDNAYLFNKAAYHFLRKNYNKTIELLQSVQYTESRYHLDSKVLLLKSFYELNDIVPLFSMLESFKVLIKRNKQLSDTYKNSYNAFVRMLKKLVRIKLGSKTAPSKLLLDLKKDAVVGEVTWLKEKIAEFEKVKSKV